MPPSFRPEHKAIDRLPQLNYSLLKDNALRKKFSELGIPNGGPRTLLVKRHTEWINLVNANCDSTKPRSKRELLHDLDVWEKTQGRQILNLSNSGGASSVMHKDFDGAAWATSHNQDFRNLIAKARRKVTPKPEEVNKINGSVEGFHRNSGSPSAFAGDSPEKSRRDSTNSSCPLQDGFDLPENDHGSPIQASYLEIDIND